MMISLTPALFMISLFNVRMIVDMIFAVAEVAIAAGTIAKFQFRIAFVCSAANRTTMGVGGFVLLFGLISLKVDGCGLCSGISCRTASPDFPGIRNQVSGILAKEQKIVG